MKQVAHKYYEGAVFGLLTIIGRAPARKQNKYVYCQCSCGNPEIIEVFIGNLGKGHTQSCGCLLTEAITKHGMHGTRIYSIHKHMLQRCYNPKKDSYKDYGAKGIKVCDRWLTFENFYEDMGEPLSDKHTLDREDFNGNYCPENCSWRLPSWQAYNQGLRVDSKTGRTGVKELPSGNWEARIGFDNGVIVLGTFSSFEEACVARTAAEIKYYGKVKQ